ncbi:MAG: glycosyltransferase [Caldilineaceae bacterium]|nr:glycosyltransferase [Caldilineaceae bacterium]
MTALLTPTASPNRPSPAGNTISVVVPARNEEGTIAQVVERSYQAFASLGRTGEVLVVNDGSRDRTGAILATLQPQYPSLRVFTHRRSQGMTAALQTMFSASQGEIVILIPADMESDPLLDVPALVHHLEGADLDVVAGWRQGRRDSKVLASQVYNVVMRSMANVPVHDGNWIKAMRREVIENLPPLRSDWHRFLLMIAAHQGFRLGEVPTHYQPRAAGNSKFGWERIPISFLDVLVLKFLLTFQQKPMRFFGGLGLAGMALSLLTFFYLTGLYFFAETQQRPIFIAAGVLAIISVLLFLVGFLAELIVSQGERIDGLERQVKAQSSQEGINDERDGNAAPTTP